MQPADDLQGSGAAVVGGELVASLEELTDESRDGPLTHFDDRPRGRPSASPLAVSDDDAWTQPGPAREGPAWCCDACSRCTQAATRP